MITETMLMMYLEDCAKRSRLDWKSVKAYRCDLRQFLLFLDGRPLNKALLEAYVRQLHLRFAPKSVMRKLASLHAFFSYLVFQELLAENPLDRIRTHFQKPLLLPRTIPWTQMQAFFRHLYRQRERAQTPYQKLCATRSIAVFEVLLSTGVRISELCALRVCDVDLQEGCLHIYGKGRKERRLPLGSSCVRNALQNYHHLAHPDAAFDDPFFINRNGSGLSDQSVRALLHRYCCDAAITPHITPHMFRHTFASLLLEEDVDIRFIQHILGHSSITTTQIYTHVSDAKQKEILRLKNPLNRLSL